jgi:cephalosporin-C deacetylase-like acetyl esterase
MVRSTIERLIGLTGRFAQVVGRFAGDGFTVERVIFNSLPNYAVTANVFVPAGRPGRVPAVVISPGHSANGKGGDYAFAANVARNGMIALTYDPIGQGERLQAVDPATQTSRIGRPTGEHGHASIKTMLMGEHIARYFVWDAIRRRLPASAR